jgi:hypothetical protein
LSWLAASEFFVEHTIPCFILKPTLISLYSFIVGHLIYSIRKLRKNFKTLSKHLCAELRETSNLSETCLNVSVLLRYQIVNNSAFVLVILSLPYSCAGINPLFSKRPTIIVANLRSTVMIVSISNLTYKMIYNSPGHSKMALEHLIRIFEDSAFNIVFYSSYFIYSNCITFIF